MKHNPYKIVKMFEEEVAEYTGAPCAVATDSCTSALTICCKYLNVIEVIIPKRTYVSVPAAIQHAGGSVKFEDLDWEGIYQLKPYLIYDAAKRFTSSMYIPKTYMCLSFHIKKHLKIGKGGAILTDDLDAAKWFRQARYEGRSEIPYKDDNVSMLGWNMYMTPVEAALGLTLMQNYPEHIADLLEDNGGYKDLTEFDLYKND